MRVLAPMIMMTVLISPVCFAVPARSLEHDFGNISANAIVTHTFVFDEDIKSVIALCDCVTARLLKSPDTGKNQSRVLVELDPASYQGPVSQEIFLLDADNNRITLRLKAFVR